MRVLLESTLDKSLLSISTTTISAGYEVEKMDMEGVSERRPIWFPYISRLLLNIAAFARKC
jgi:hypothetical protein